MIGLMRVTAAAAIALWAAAASAADAIDPFVGNFVGNTTQMSGSDEAKRDLTVDVAKADDGKGFVVTWKTVIHKASGKDEEQPAVKVRFAATKRANIFSAASKQDMFGKFVPIDPVSGTDPYYWARIQGKTLSIFNILINDDGGYEMQVYHRTVAPDGTMQVKFERIRDGVSQRTVNGILRRK